MVKSWVSNARPVWRWMILLAAILLLNAALSFRNVWPTAAIRWDGALSVELAACLVLFSLLAYRFGRPPRGIVVAVAVVWVLLAIGRYAAVTAPTMYGREINLYWDSRHLGAVVGMLAAAAPTWIVLVAAAAALVAPLVLYAIVRWAFGRVAAALSRSAERRAVAFAATVALLLFVAQRSGVGAVSEAVRFSDPVIPSYARQARLLMAQLGAAPTTLPPPQRADSDLSHVRGADVILVFIESYGAVTYDRTTFSASLAPSRADLEAAARDTGRHVVSTFVESPTFGGSSWLAHISLMTGIEVRDEGTNVILMSQRRDTLVDTFKRQGYRTVAVMPGLWNPWPEGVFYGFDDIYGKDRLEYRGPRFGWWTIPEQFTLARLDAVELERRRRAPVFVFFATINTHAPFGPIAPYKEDWSLILRPDAYSQGDLAAANVHKPDLLNMAPSYTRAIAYTLQSIGGYLRFRADRDLILILLGDHQPPAAVSGEGASWQVPVHVVAARMPFLTRLEAQGFERGMTPTRSLGSMHTLQSVLLDAFGDSRGGRTVEYAQNTR